MVLASIIIDSHFLSFCTLCHYVLAVFFVKICLVKIFFTTFFEINREVVVRFV